MSRLPVAAVAFGGGQRDAQRGHEDRPVRAQAVERAGTDKRFERAPVHLARVEAPAEIEQVAERAGLAPRRRSKLSMAA